MEHGTATAEATRRKAVWFIVLLGIVSLFADMTYEGARSATGPFLLTLGAGAGAVGVIAGVGELIGYTLRLGTGYLADRLRRYWLLTGVGYFLNLAAVPLLAFAGRWEVAAGLIVLERLGKAIRTPSRDTLISFASSRVGRGYAFGLHEALDQIGAVVGPLLVAGALLQHQSYRWGFGILAIPAVLSLTALALARWSFRAPEELEKPVETGGQATLDAPSRRQLLGYAWFVALTVAGFAHFTLISYHLKASGLLADSMIPVAFAVAMAVDAAAGLWIGHLYDRKGMATLAALPAVTVLAVLSVFNSRLGVLWLGIVLWGAALGMQETVLKAAVADLVPAARRGTAFGLYNALFGVAWFAGSAIMGFLYDLSLPSVLVYVLLTQVGALVLLGRIGNRY